MKKIIGYVMLSLVYPVAFAAIFTFGGIGLVNGLLLGLAMDLLFIFMYFGIKFIHEN
jgi:hypothetical protein